MRRSGTGEFRTPTCLFVDADTPYRTIPAARRAHLGGSSRTTLKKKSVRRTEAIFGQGSMAARAPNADLLPTENLLPKQTQEERDRILTWVRTRLITSFTC